VTLIVDDALLMAVLAGTVDDEVQDAAANGEVFTTGTWYWRLGRALHDAGSAGALSRALADLTWAQQALVLASVEDLPPGIGLLSLRDLVPVMTGLAVGRRLNLLTAEAIAAALVLEATIVVTTESALLTESCARLGIDIRQVA
jgi:hypothetical protein